MACDAVACLPPGRVSFTANYVPREDADASGLLIDLGEIQQKFSHAIVRGVVEPKVAAPGEPIQLKLTIEPTDGYHVYALERRDPQDVSKPDVDRRDATVRLVRWHAGARTASARESLRRRRRRRRTILREAGLVDRRDSPSQRCRARRARHRRVDWLSNLPDQLRPPDGGATSRPE